MWAMPKTQWVIIYMVHSNYTNGLWVNSFKNFSKKIEKIYGIKVYRKIKAKTVAEISLLFRVKMDLLVLTFDTS